MPFDELTGAWLAKLSESVPGLELFDAHTHIGQNDPDGFSSAPDQLNGRLVAAGARGVVFPMHEPEGYRRANEAVIEAAERSAGRLVAFCRLDPRAGPLEEAERSLAAGAAGIKLHPRAEGFPLDTSELEPVFALADERKLPVLVHAGRGIPALGRHAVAILERHPRVRLILAHAGISDLAWIWRAVEGHPNLFFDTAWWTPSDLLALYALVPPRNILFASDAPYASPAFAATANLRYAMQAGLSSEQIRLVFGGQLVRILAGEEPLDAGPATGSSRLDNDPLLDRVYAFLVASIGQMVRGVEPAEMLALAALACEVGDDVPQAPVCKVVLHLLELRARLLASGDGDGRPPHFAPWPEPVVLAAGVARTPAVPVPAVDGAAVDVGAREP